MSLRTRVVSLRLTDEEHATLSTFAHSAGIDLSELIRRAALGLTYDQPPRNTTMTMAAPLARVHWQVT